MRSWLIAIVCGLAVASTAHAQGRAGSASGAGAAVAAARDDKAGTPTPPPAWTDAEVIAAKDQCLRLLGPVQVTVTALPPVRDGRCGTPAPVLLRSIGGDAPLALAPPQQQSCRMVVALHDWATRVVQPLAKSVLGEPVREIAGLSSYHCRDIAGLKGELSEHGLVNAIDIARFVTASGRVIDLKRGWGPTRRDAAPPASAGAAAARKASPPDAAIRGGRSATGVPKPSVTAERTFLHLVHAGACRHFATVLGPEANDDHRDHFHFDMGGRPGDICE